MALKAEEMIQRQQTLAEQLKTSAQQQAQSQYRQGNRTLMEQLRSGRAETAKSRSQLSEQSYLANRGIQQGATSRGLGSSGMKDLSLLQSQLNQGQGVNQIQQQAEGLRRTGMMAQLGMQDNLTNQLNQAESGYQANMVDADRFGMQMQNEKTSQLMHLYQMALDSGGTADIPGLAAMLGINLETDLTPEQQGALKGASPVPVPEDKRAFGFDVWNRLKGQSLVQENLKLFTGGKWNQAYTYDFGNGKEKMSVSEAKNRVEDLFKGKQYVGKEITIAANEGELAHQIGFKYNGKIYKTYNAAKQALEKDLPKR